MVSEAEKTLIHAVALAAAVDADGPLCGVLLLGEAGAGKSSLALGFIETCPWRRSALIADDAVLLAAKSGGLVARAPQTITGLIEIRGFGPASVRTAPPTRLWAAFRLCDDGERTPEPEVYAPIPGGPALAAYPFRYHGEAAIAPHRLRRIIRSIVGGQNWRCRHDSRSHLGMAE
ncbi:MAG: hypothetical protein KDA46_07010 [Parvularculaceae bacterium]|nr:hypothetical protein [Parvularculaceae bacterium]